MANPNLRFIHASDFHLERPLRGAEDLPEALGELMIEAPQRAAERVFDAALREQVDFVLLAGDLLRPMAAGPRALVFLVDQFERLNERQVPIYWATGRADSATRWTEVLHLPPNVQVFTGHQVRRVAFERDTRLRADILAAGAHEDGGIRLGEFRAAHGHLTIALAYGRLESPASTASGVHYWALGGEHRRRVLSSRAPVVHYPGSPQGHSPRERGPHGATLVQVDEHHQIRTRQIVCDAVRWHDEHVQLDTASTAGALERLLENRARSLLTATSQRDLVVRWKVQAPPRLAAELRHGKLAGEILSRLRSHFATHRPALWSWSLEAQSPAGVPGEWYNEETIRGEFMRAMRHYTSADAPAPDLQPYLSAGAMADRLATAALLEDAAVRRRVLAQATVLGADLLSGEEPPA